MHHVNGESTSCIGHYGPIVIGREPAPDDSQLQKRNWRTKKPGFLFLASSLKSTDAAFGCLVRCRQTRDTPRQGLGRAVRRFRDSSDEARRGRLELVPVVGLEPTRPSKGPQDFKSCASAISPHRHGRVLRRLDRRIGSPQEISAVEYPPGALPGSNKIGTRRPHPRAPVRPGGPRGCLGKP